MVTHLNVKHIMFSMFSNDARPQELTVNLKESLCITLGKEVFLLIQGIMSIMLSMLSLDINTKKKKKKKNSHVSIFSMDVVHIS